MGFTVRLEMPLNSKIVDLLHNLESKAPAAARRAISSAIKIPLRRARTMVPRDSGLLRKSLTSRAFIRKDKTAIIGEMLVKKGQTVRVVRRGKKKATKANPYYYMHLMELGTQPHAVGKGSQIWEARPKKGYAGRKGKQHGARHPGTKPMRFLEQAMKQSQSQMESAVETQLYAELDKLWNVN